MMKVLLTDGSYKHTLGILVYLRRLGFCVDFVGDKNSICHFASGKGHCAVSEIDFYNFSPSDLAKFLCSQDYQVVIPIGARSVHKIAQCLSEAAVSTRCMVPSLRQYNLASDKFLITNIAKKLKIPVPLSISLKSNDQIINKSIMNGAVVVKGIGEEIKFGPYYHKNIEDALKSINNHDFRKPLIVQQRVAGYGVGFFALYENGKCLKSYCHKRVREYPLSGGVSTAAEILNNELLESYGRALLDELKWHGVAMVEFKYDPIQDELYLIEVNPKFWGSHDLALANNINFPLEIVQRVTRRPIECDNDTNSEGIRFIWPLEGDLHSIFHNRQNLTTIVADILNPKVRSNLYWRQPKLITAQFYQFFRNMLIRNKQVRGLHSFYTRCKLIGIKYALIRSLTEISGIPLLKYSKITEYISVGPQQGKIGRRYLEANGYSSCLSLRKTTSDKDLNVDLEHSLTVPVTEYCAPTKEQLHEGAKFINENIKSRRPVYIHCREGISRAPLFLVAYFIIYQNMSLNEAIQVIKKVRPFINILPNQIDIIKEITSSNSN